MRFIITARASADKKANELENKGHELELKQKLIERKDRDIAYRDAKIEKITFEPARLKRWKLPQAPGGFSASPRLPHS